MTKITPLVLLMVMGFTVTSWADDGHKHHEHNKHANHEMDKKKKDHMHASVQKICPVTGNKLGTHGTPIKVTVGKDKQEIFLCCKGCLSGKIDTKHWTTVNANLVKAQGKCPVMQKKLPKNPKWVVVKGKIVFVCCPPCTDKIKRDPKTYLSKVDGYYQASLKANKKH